MLLDQAWLQEWTGRLRAVPGHRVLGVYLRGSHAQGVATRYSDVDFDVLVDGGPQVSYPAWLEPHGERLVHVSATLADATGFLRAMNEPADWSFGWPVRAPLRPLWTDPSRPDLVLHELTSPAGDPLLENVIEDFSKVCSALHRGDQVGLLTAAHELAREIPTLLRLANPPRTVANRAEAWQAALSLPVAPEGYLADMRQCLGWNPGSPQTIAAAAHRLATATMPLIRPHAQALAHHGDLAEAIRDGRIDRYLTQLANTH